MSVTVDCHSAARLVAEGAVCFDTDTQTATCDGLTVNLSSAVSERTRPVLVCGASAAQTAAMVGRLERLGVAAWRVCGDDPGGSAAAPAVGKRNRRSTAP